MYSPLLTSTFLSCIFRNPPRLSMSPLKKCNMHKFPTCFWSLSEWILWLSYSIVYLYYGTSRESADERQHLDRFTTAIECPKLVFLYDILCDSRRQVLMQENEKLTLWRSQSRHSCQKNSFNLSNIVLQT